jgi:putative transposase
MWNTIDQKCWQAKNLYNYANYIVRQEFINKNFWTRYRDLDKLLQTHETYKTLGSQASQNTLTLLDRNWKSFFVSIKDWSKKKGDGYFGKPRLPKYKDKLKGRSILIIKNIQCKIKDGKVMFSWHPLKSFSGIPTKVLGHLQQVRFVPTGNCYTMEVVYNEEIATEEKAKNNRVASIDLGVNNFATIVNNIGLRPIFVKGGIIKSMNRYYNKERANISRETGMIWNNRMRNLTDKHNCKTDTYMHTVSKRIVQYCIKNNIDTLIIGLSKEWKNESNIGHVNNQNFISIPHEKLIKQLQYKCENIGINCIINEENFTSGTSFLDNELPTEENYNIKRRIKRGLFKSNDGRTINADVNAAYQIMRKVFPEALQSVLQRNRGCDSHPIKLII